MQAQTGFLDRHVLALTVWQTTLKFAAPANRSRSVVEEQEDITMSATRTVGLVGRKAGMTRVFNDAGEAVPVTVIEALPNRVTQVRTAETDGYRAVQVAFGSRKASHLTKPQAGSLCQGQSRSRSSPWSSSV